MFLGYHVESLLEHLLKLVVTKFSKVFFIDLLFGELVAGKKKQSLWFALSFCLRFLGNKILAPLLEGLAHIF